MHKWDLWSKLDYIITKNNLTQYIVPKLTTESIICYISESEICSRFMNSPKILMRTEMKDVQWLGKSRIIINCCDLVIKSTKLVTRYLMYGILAFITLLHDLTNEMICSLCFHISYLRIIEFHLQYPASSVE